MKHLFKILGLAAIIAISPFSFAQQDALTSTQVKQVQEIIHSYLVANPQILVEVSQQLQKQQMAGMEKQAKSAVEKNAKQILNASTSPVAGNAKGAVTLVEFYDYQCPHCQDMVDIVNNLVKQNSDLKVVYKEFPIFPNSKQLAVAALAANTQGKFLAFHDALMKAMNAKLKEVRRALTSKETTDMINQVAKTAGLNMDQFQKDLSSNKSDDEIKANYQLANDLGFQGTPAFIISNSNGTEVSVIPGQTSQENLQGMINKFKKS